MHPETTIDDTLRLARDLCLGVGAFFVTPAGSVFSSTSGVTSPEQHEDRITALARSCLTHPSARGTSLFWSAEVAEESVGPLPDTSLACVVAPVWSGPTWMGLLGVVDVWLPELDEEQRAGLLALAARLGDRQGPAPAAAPAAPPAPAAAPAPPAPPAPAAPPAPYAVAPELPHTAEPFLGEVLDNLPDGLLVTRSDGAIVLANQAFAAMTGLSMDAILGEDVAAVLEPEGEEVDEAARRAWRRAGSGSGRQDLLSRVLGRPEPGVAVRVGGASGTAVGLDATGRAVASRFAGDCFVTLVRATREPVPGGGPQLGIQNLLDHIEDGIVCCDASGTVVVANRAARSLQGLHDDELVVGQPLPTVTRLRTVEGSALDPENHPLVRVVREGAPISTELLLDTPDRQVRVAVSTRPLRVDGGDGAIAVLRDVTAEHERQEHLTHFALHDSLTGVANRYLLHDALGRMLDGLVRRGGFVSLIYLDLDEFKAINDRHGHDTGDEVLRAVARRLERAVRGEDIVARLGGDEFVIAHVTADRLSDGDAVVARIRKVLSAPYRFGELVLDVGASIGWVSTTSGGESPGSLISQADRAMYDHKHRRREAADAVPV